MIRAIECQQARFEADEGQGVAGAYGIPEDAACIGVEATGNVQGESLTGGMKCIEACNQSCYRACDRAAQADTKQTVYGQCVGWGGRWDREFWEYRAACSKPGIMGNTGIRRQVCARTSEDQVDASPAHLEKARDDEGITPIIARARQNQDGVLGWSVSQQTVGQLCGGPTCAFHQGWGHVGVPLFDGAQR